MAVIGIGLHALFETIGSGVRELPHGVFEGLRENPRFASMALSSSV